LTGELKSFITEVRIMATRKRELRRRYDSTAYLYDRRYQDIQGRKYEAIAPYVSGAGTALDVGCGTGMFMPRLAEGASFVVGVDLSAQMLRKVKELANVLGLVQADADHLPFCDNSFDAVVAVTLLQNAPDPGRTVRELARVTRPGGTVVVTTLRQKHTTDQLEGWVRSAKLKPLRTGRIPDSEDIICAARR